MPWTNTTIESILATVLQNGTFDYPPSVWLGLALSPGPPTNAGTFNEVTTAQWPGGEYGRRVITFGNAPASRSLSNTASITFTTPTTITTPFTVSHGGVFSLQTGGVFMAWGPLATPLVIGNGTLVSIPIGSLTITDPGTLV